MIPKIRLISASPVPSVAAAMALAQLLLATAARIRQQVPELAAMPLAAESTARVRCCPFLPSLRRIWPGEETVTVEMAQAAWEETAAQVARALTANGVPCSGLLHLEKMVEAAHQARWAASAPEGMATEERLLEEASMASPR